MIKIQLGNWFGLPRVGPDVFSRLMRQARLNYDRQKRMFMVTPETDVSALISILKEALKQDVVVELPCFVCGKSAGCSECEFCDVCDRTSVSNRCICKECSGQKEAYAKYCDVFLRGLAAAKIKI
ncbi:MAG: hypothetical protein ACE5JV_01880 [Nitrososphaerales archaeon]